MFVKIHLRMTLCYLLNYMKPRTSYFMLNKNSTPSKHTISHLFLQIPVKMQFLQNVAHKCTANKSSPYLNQRIPTDLEKNESEVFNWVRVHNVKLLAGLDLNEIIIK